jgi:hypothetical protein
MKVAGGIGSMKSMKRIINPRGLGVFLSLLLCSCATENPVPSQLPAAVAINKDAGRGGLLKVMVRLATGEKLSLLVDTGMPLTAFDRSLEPKLGQRLYTGTLWNFGVKQDMGVYAPPKLYLGNVLLRTTGKNVVTFERQKLASQGGASFMGVIGMDVLQNYCIQLDFAAGQMRFLDDEHADKRNWGEPFPLTDIGDGCFSINENLAGLKGPASMIDTGCDFSGWLQPELFRQWTNQESAADQRIHSPDGTLGGVLYRNLDLRVLDAKKLAGDDAHLKFNGIGLRVLAQNLVILDFPKRTMYLKHTSISPLVSHK